MRLVYFGSGDFGIPTLLQLIVEHEVALVVTQPDRPAGRKRQLRPTPIGAIAESLGLQVIKSENVNEPEIVEHIASERPEALIVIAFGQKLGNSLLEYDLAINLHASLLPKYRGAAPINWAVINGERETGVSVIRLSNCIDAGDVLCQRSIAIDPLKTAGELEQKLSELGPELVAQVLSDFQANDLKAISQDDKLASKAPKMSKADGTVSFDQPAKAVQNRVHGLTPWPGCAVAINNERLRILRVDVLDGTKTDELPGQILADGSVACASGAIRLLAVQPPGGKSMSFDAYRRGHELPVGTRLESL